MIVTSDKLDMNSKNAQKAKNMQKMIDTIHVLGRKLEGEQRINKQNLSGVEEITTGALYFSDHLF